MRSGTTAWLVTAVLALPVTAAAAAGHPERVDARLRQALEGPLPAGGLRVGVVLGQGGLPGFPFPDARREQVRERLARVLSALPAESLAVGRRFETLGGFSGWAQAAAIDALARHPEVAAVYLDGRLHPELAEGVPLVGADLVHARGYTGEGISVAVLDTGIDTDHADLADDLVIEQCFCNDTPNPNRGCCANGRPSQSGPGAAEDLDGHGTAVSGIVTSANAAASGVAPEAGVVAIQVFDPTTGAAAFSDVAAALEWVLDNRTAYEIRAVNLSLGDGRENDDANASPCSNTNTANAIAALHDVGVVTFASSGNQAHVAGIAFPACVSWAISVGGVYDAALGSTSWCSPSGCDSILCTDNPTAADVFVCHSNSGSLLDVLAPNWKTRTTGLGGGLVDFGGTSASSPYAVAQAALLLQADPTLTPESLRSLLTTYATSVTNPANGLVHPRSDVGLALSAIAEPPGTPVPSLAPVGRALLALLLATSVAAVGGARRPFRRRGVSECP